MPLFVASPWWRGSSKADPWTGFGTLLQNKTEWQKTDNGLMTWMMFHALRSPTPYVLSNRALTKQWVPPYNVSAVPRNVRTKIPERFRYWTFEDTAKRRAVRDQLVTEIKKKLGSKKRVDRRSTG